MKRIITCLAVLCCTAALLPAQENYKSVKDKATKLYGYQDSSKKWVIAPAFDKAKNFQQGVAIVTIGGLQGVIDPTGAWLVQPELYDIDAFDRDGLSKVMIKENRSKIYGVINLAGDFVVPVDCADVKIENKRGLIQANKFFDVENPELYSSSYTTAWTVYDFQGNQLFEPQFRGQLSFYDGRAIATRKGSGLEGVVDLDGNTLLPFDYYYVYSSGNGYHALDKNMRIVTISHDFRTVTDDNLPESAPWMVQGYDPKGDLVRAFAYGHRFIGEKLYKNNVWNISMENSASSRIPGLTSQLTDASGRQVDWGRRKDCFIRLEPVVDTQGRPESFEYNISGQSYTIQAILYDAVGREISVLSDWGYIKYEALEGIVYMAEGKRSWFISRDINWPDEVRPLYLTDAVSVNNSTITSALDMKSNEMNDMRGYWTSKAKFTEVELQERSGYQSYSNFFDARSFSSQESKFSEMIARQYPFLGKRYYQGQIYQIARMSRKDVEASVVLDPMPMAVYHDDYGHSFTLNSVEPIYWGVRGDRYVRIQLYPFVFDNPEKTKGMRSEDIESKIAVSFVFNLYEDDGTFVRTLGRSDCMSIAGKDIFGFEDLGWVFTRRIPERGEIRFIDDHPYTGTVADFKWVDF